MARRPSQVSAALRRACARNLASTSIAALGAALAVAEVLHWRASWSELGAEGASGRTEAVVVLGYRNRGTRANGMNRWRVRAGIRSLDPRADESRLVLCGGAVGGRRPEAELMRAYARERGYSGEILLDRVSRSTWQNIENAIPFIEDAAAIKVVSNSLHAARARAYLRRLRPDLATRLARGGDYRVGEQLWLKPIAVVIDLRHSLRSRRETPAGPVTLT